MKKLFKLLFILIIGLYIIGCCAHSKVTKYESLGSLMRYALVIDNAKEYQVDSLITADTLPELDRWLGTTFIDHTTQEAVTKRMYIRKKSNGEVVYIVTGNTEPFKIIKRINN